MITRRSLLAGFLAAPAVVAAGSLMPVRSWPIVGPVSVAREIVAFHADHIVEFMVLDRMATPDEVAKITAYMRAKWGMAVVSA